MEDFRKKKLKKGEKNLWQQLGRDEEQEVEEVPQEPEKKEEEDETKFKLIRGLFKRK